MNCEIIVIGDELLIGQVVDTNSGMLARYLGQIGITIARTTAVHDNESDILTALTEAFSRTDLVFTTGGLGPTKDDITKLTLCKYFNTHLVEDNTVKHHIEKLYQDRPQVLNSLTATQWMVPQAANILTNRVGSAPIMEFVNDTKRLYSMPGVPYEAQVAMEEQIIPRLKESAQTSVVIHRTIILYGIPESSLALLIEDWENNLPDYMHLAYLPSNRMIRLRLTAVTPALPLRYPCATLALQEEMDERLAELLPLIEDYLIATEDKPLEVLVGECLKQYSQTVSTAESCTGGKLAALLNKHAGSSQFYFGSVVAYDNSVKQNMLGVNPDTLLAFGAVSEQTVREMADNIRRLADTTWSIATSGIAGPEGGTKDKPVGTVWIAVSGPDGTTAECRHFRGSRIQITDQAVIVALIMLLKRLQQYSKNLK